MQRWSGPTQPCKAKAVAFDAGAALTAEAKARWPLLVPRVAAACCCLCSLLVP